MAPATIAAMVDGRICTNAGDLRRVMFMTRMCGRGRASCDDQQEGDKRQEPTSRQQAHLRYSRMHLRNRKEELAKLRRRALRSLPFEPP